MTVSNEIINVLNFFGNKFGIAIDWTNTNVIPYVQELMGKYISWEIATSTTWIIIGVIAIIIGITCIIIDIKIDCDMILLMFGGVLLVVGIFGVCDQIFDILKCTYFPELQVLEYVKTFVAQNK